jgi:hypothetical protein
MTLWAREGLGSQLLQHFEVAHIETVLWNETRLMCVAHSCTDEGQHVALWEYHFSAWFVVEYRVPVVRRGAAPSL